MKLEGTGTSTENLPIDGDNALTRLFAVETMGLEPTTPCLQSRCSSQLSYVPEVTRRPS